MPPKPQSENTMPGELLQAHDAVRRWLMAGNPYISQDGCADGGIDAEQLLWQRCFGLFTSATNSQMPLSTFKFVMRAAGQSVLHKGEGRGVTTCYFNLPAPPQEYESPVAWSPILDQGDPTP
jgi:hypothetical protein